MVTQITNENVFCWVLRIPSAVKKNKFPKKYKTGIVRASDKSWKTGLFSDKPVF